jgi:DNA invertase Pin-like site-specific DNA recombinase
VAASGVGLVTLMEDPDATPEEIRSHQTHRGLKAKGKKGGRPKKRSRTELMAEAQRLHEQGHSQVVIAGQLGVDPTTVSRWLRKDEK